MNTVTMERGLGLRLAAKIAVFLCIIIFLYFGSGQIVNFFAFQMWPRHVDMIIYLLFSSAAAYVVLMAVPFMPGRHLPPRILARVLDWFHLDRARDLVVDLAPPGSEKRLHLLRGSTPTRVVPFLLRHRYLFIAFLLNLHGIHCDIARPDLLPANH